MELQQLRYAVALAETRNFTRAAERCHVVQSALSHQIKALENELGTRLFARTSRRVELTVAGERFLAPAREALAAVDRAEAEAATASGEITGRLTVGLIPTVTALDVPRALGDFRRAHPGVRVALRGGVSEELTRGLTSGEVDIAVLGLPETAAPPGGIEMRELARDRHVAVLSPRHRLAARKRLRLDDLADEAFADFPAESGGRSQSDLAFGRAGLARTVVFEAVSPELICGLVEQDLAVALLPSAFVQDRAGIVAIPVAQGPSRVEYLAWNGFNPSSAASAFLSLLPR